MNELQEVFLAGMMVAGLTIGVLKIVAKNLIEEWNTNERE